MYEHPFPVQVLFCFDGYLLAAHFFLQGVVWKVLENTCDDTQRIRIFIELIQFVAYLGCIDIQQTGKVFIDEGSMSVFLTGFGRRESGNLSDIHRPEESGIRRDMYHIIMLDAAVGLPDGELAQPAV